MALSHRPWLLSACITLCLALPALAADDVAKPESTGAKPTHKQSSLININADGLAQATAQCFCLTADDRLLAACSGAASQIRVFRPSGEFVAAFDLPVSPEAINVAPDGTILVAGEGHLLRLSSEGKVLANVESPHAAALRANEKQIREDAINQFKQQREVLPQLLESYDTAIKGLEEQIAELEKRTDAQAELDATKQMIDVYKQARQQMVEQFSQQGDKPAELTEEQIADMTKSAIAQKLRVASISASKDAVFIATTMPVGYGYEVWRLSPELTDGKMIVADLSGCCGQMDVQANDDGVFVAENSRKRVRRFDPQGQLICEWGKASEGVDGFGSCCNPMNLAFGAGGAVYTAEDTTGRIKRYSNDGKLLSVIGAADVVPGCKKVSIGVSKTGDAVYMLDITRNQINVLSRVLPDPTEPISEAQAASEGGGGGGLLKLIFGG